MKKQIRQKSIIALWLMASVLISGLFFASQAHAQGAKRIAQKSDVWSAAYTVTIKGEGTEKPELGSGDPEIIWKVYRIYTGSVRLRSGVSVTNPKWSAKEREESKWTERKLSFKDPSPQVHVIIKDYVETTSDPTCEEYIREIETWDADVRGVTPSGDVALLAIDNKYLTYDVSFPVMYMPKGVAADVKYRKDTFYLPKGEHKIGEPKYSSILTYRIPDIKDWLEKNGEVTRDSEPMLKESGSYGLKSDKITVNESLLKGINTSGKVTIQIEYIIRKDEG